MNKAVVKCKLAGSWNIEYSPDFSLVRSKVNKWLQLGDFHDDKSKKIAYTFAARS